MSIEVNRNPLITLSTYTCPISIDAVESVNHLPFYCKSANRCWKNSLWRLMFSGSLHNLSRIIASMERLSTAKKKQEVVEWYSSRGGMVFVARKK